MPGVQSQERTQQEIAAKLGHIEELLRCYSKATTVNERLVERQLRCGMHMSRDSEGYIQTIDGTQWEFRPDDSLSLKEGCLVMRTTGHDGRGNDGHATILIPLSRVVAISIT